MQTAIDAGRSLTYHDYEGIALHEDEKRRLVADLGDEATMMLRNHGPDHWRSRADAFMHMYLLEAACTIPVRASAPSGMLRGPGELAIA